MRSKALDFAGALIVNKARFTTEKEKTTMAALAFFVTKDGLGLNHRLCPNLYRHRAGRIGSLVDSFVELPLGIEWRSLLRAEHQELFELVKHPLICTARGY